MSSDDDDAKMLLARVAAKLEHHNAKIEDVDKKMDEVLQRALPSIREDIATLKVKSGVWGAIAGAIPGVLALVWHLLG